MNIAIIIGISNYKSIQPLPACAKDRDSIVSFLKSTSKYDDMLILKGDEKSCHEDKQELVAFLKKHQDQKIDELLFYFSGHGDFDGTEFYYIWSDFDRDRKRQTSLQNEEIDILIRNISPTITFKIIDACHSGISYIKDADKISEYIKSNKTGFNKCYFLFSSQADQSSYANEEFSFFTKAFISSFKLKKGDKIRYKDIIDSISDEFENKSYQRPYFLIQADFTEIFCEINDNVLNNIKKLDNEKPQPENQISQTNKLISAIQKEADRYITKEEAIFKVNSLKDHEGYTNFSHDIFNFYDCTANINLNYDNLPQLEQLLFWLQLHEKELFINIKTAERIIKVPVQNNIQEVKNSTEGNKKENTIFKHHRISNYPIRFTSTVEFEFNTIIIEFLPKFPNLPKEKIFLIPLISKTQLKVFYARVTYIEQSWGEFKTVLDNFKWNYIAFDLKPVEPIKEIREKIITIIANEMLEDLERKFTDTNEEKTSK